jgi:hypothetical protein
MMIDKSTIAADKSPACILLLVLVHHTARIVWKCDGGISYVDGRGGSATQNHLAQPTILGDGDGDVSVDSEVKLTSNTFFPRAMI